MRRQEFEAGDRKEIEAFLHEMTFGFLGMVRKDGSPSVTPLNFVYFNDAVYFHGSHAGEKMASLAAEARVSFAVASEYAFVPSYFSDPELACPATSYFKSVSLSGRAVVVDDPREKAEAMAAFMRKLQPEGGYRPIDADDPKYAPRLKGVAVVKLEVERMSGKFKFGQNLKGDKLRGVMDGLAERGRPADEATLEMMRKYCPHAPALQDGGSSG